MALPSDDMLLVNDGMTALIVVTLIQQRNEERHPGFDPDRMDDKIANCKRRVTLLRKMRDDFENEMSDQL